MAACLRLSLIVPCYNEAQRLAVGQYREFLDGSKRTQVIFVDDGSSDATLQVLGDVCCGYSDRTTILSYGANRGKAEAVRFGFNYALQNAADVIGFWDADLATPLAELPGLLRVLESRPEIQMVFGARVKLLGRKIARIPIRHYLGRVFATFVSQALNLPIYDTQCGAKLFRVTGDLERAFAPPFLSKWIFDVEILARFLEQYVTRQCDLAGAIYEYPLSNWVDIGGSKVKPRHFVIAFVDVLRITRHLRRALSVGPRTADGLAAHHHSAVVSNSSFDLPESTGASLSEPVPVKTSGGAT